MPAQSLNISIEQGSTFSMRIQLTSDTLDFTGSSGRGQIKKHYSDKTPLTSFAVILGQNLDLSFFLDIGLTAEQTAALPAARNQSSVQKSIEFVYDLELVLSDTVTVIRLLNGKVTMSPEITT